MENLGRTTEHITVFPGIQVRLKNGKSALETKTSMWNARFGKTVMFACMPENPKELCTQLNFQLRLSVL